MFLQQLFEAIDRKHAAFCFGRMNPPTVGHGQLINTVAQAAGSGDYYIFTSQTQDAKKNPLDYATKVKFIKALFPEHAGHVVQDSSLKTIIQVAQWLYDRGYRSVTFVAGSDRLENFKELLTKYNGVEGAAGFYQFDSIEFASSGERDPDADGIAGVSASAAREAAAAGDSDAFAQATGAGEVAEPLYLAVRRGMLVEGEADPYKKYPRAMFPDTKARNMRIAAQKRLDNIKRREKYNTGNNDSNTSPYGAADYTSGSVDEGWKGALAGELAEAHQHTEVIKYKVGDWTVYLDNHSIPRAMTRGIGPLMVSNLVTAVTTIPNLKNKVPVGGAFWVKDNKTSSSLYFKRLDIPGEPQAVRCETAVKDEPRANSRTPVFAVNAYTGPERPENKKVMARLKYISQFTGINPIASKFSQGIQQGKMGDRPELIRDPKTQDSHRYDRAFKQALKMDKVDENASGYIPKNKREAKDPRWSHALTVDVKPNTPNKNMKALRLN
jgi:hypothetical protein